ncbi:Phage X family protein [compost metagenome]
MPISDQAELALPRRLKEIYRLWRAGAFLKDEYAKSTFLNYRAKLIEFGIDLSQPPSIHLVSRDTPLSDLFTPERAAVVPVWAIGSNLFFDPITRQYARPPIVRVPDPPTLAVTHQPDAITALPANASLPPPQQEVVHQEDSIVNTKASAAVMRDPMAWFIERPNVQTLNRAAARRQGARRKSQVRTARASLGPRMPFSEGPLTVAPMSNVYSKVIVALSGTVRLVCAPAKLAS